MRHSHVSGSHGRPACAFSDLPQLEGVNPVPSWRVWVAVCTIFFAASGPAAGADLELASDWPRALSPEASRALFRLPPGFSIEPVATEPLLADPVAMAFDASGALFVCEIHGYNLEGYLDVLELNRTGELDTAVRRDPGQRSAAQQQAAAEQYGTVKRLEDTNGDGRFDRMSPCGRTDCPVATG
jgi:hypothetical protein